MDRSGVQNVSPRWKFPYSPKGISFVGSIKPMWALPHNVVFHWHTMCGSLYAPLLFSPMESTTEAYGYGGELQI
jgi:hypothetical protein